MPRKSQCRGSLSAEDASLVSPERFANLVLNLQRTSRISDGIDSEDCKYDVQEN